MEKQIMAELTSIQHGYVSKEEAEAEAVASKERSLQWMSGNKGIQVQVGGDGSMTTRSLAPTKKSSKDVFGSDSDPQSILSTAKSKSGRPMLQSEVTGDTLITYQGQTFTADLAAKMGLLHKGKDGEFTDPRFPDYDVYTAEDRKAVKAQEAPSTTGHRAALLGPEAEVVTQVLEEKLGPTTVSNMVGKAIAGFFVDPSTGTKAVEKFSEESGLSFDESKNYLNTAVNNAMGNACSMAARYLSANGSPTTPEKVYEFFKSCQPEVKVNLSLRLLAGDVSAAQTLVARYRHGNRF
jgi:hypothetical protein